MGCVDGAVGAVDGLFVRIEAPASSDDLHQMSYYSGATTGYEINVQAIATATYRFRCVVAKHPGCANNFCASQRSDIQR